MARRLNEDEGTRKKRLEQPLGSGRRLLAGHDFPGYHNDENDDPGCVTPQPTLLKFFVIYHVIHLQPLSQIYH